jgi:hypothetical protein
MSAFRRMDCLNALGAVLLAGLFTAPLLASDAAETKKPAHKDSRPAQARSTGIRGRVTDGNGKPLADVRLWLGWREDDQGQKPLVVKTDAQGNYRLDLPDVKQPTLVGLDSKKPGFARRSATWSGPWAMIASKVTPGQWAECDLKLRPALYVAGTVVDEQGKPISGVQVTADQLGVANGSATIESTESDSDGSFELFNFPLKPPTAGKDVSKGLISFSHASFMDFAIPDAYALAPRERDRLPVVLKSGRKIAGTVLDVAGKPFPDAIVKATAPDGSHRRVTGSDAEGNFVLGGLSDGPTLLTVVVPKIKQKGRIPLNLHEDHHDLKVRLQSISLPKDMKTYTVLGLVLADMTPELRAAYELHSQPGVFVLQHRKNADPEQMIEEGSLISSVDDQPVGNVRDFAARVLAAAAKDKAREHMIDLVYATHDEPDGISVSQLKLTPADLEEISDLLSARLAADQEAILALGRLGAQFRLKQPDDHSEAGPEVSVIVLGNKWKGGDSD